MSRRSKQLLALAAILAALGGTTIAWADGDNSMNPITGDSRAKFDADNPNLTVQGEQSNSGAYTYAQSAPQGSEAYVTPETDSSDAAGAQTMTGDQYSDALAQCDTKGAEERQACLDEARESYEGQVVPDESTSGEQPSEGNVSG